MRHEVLLQRLQQIEIALLITTELSTKIAGGQVLQYLSLLFHELQVHFRGLADDGGRLSQASSCEPEAAKYQ